MQLIRDCLIATLGTAVIYAAVLGVLFTFDAMHKESQAFRECVAIHPVHNCL